MTKHFATVDEIVSRGTIQTDPAMSAWNAGDYATAEIEFKQNAFCALRVERNFQAGIENAQRSAERANVDVSANLSSTQGGQGNTFSAPTSAPTTSTNAEARSRKNAESATKRTCADRGFQIYMMGMSQLKLGKREEAKKSLYRAAAMRKNLTDAHFRLSLLAYQDGEIDEANKQFKKLRKLQPKCKGCAGEKEIQAQIDYLKNLLG